jgi:hypothetical protein
MCSLPFHLKTKTECFRERWVLLLNIRHWTNSRNPVILNVTCPHQNTLRQRQFCYWGDKNPIFRKISSIYFESIKQTHFFRHSWTGDYKIRIPMRVKYFSKDIFCQKSITNRLSLPQVQCNVRYIAVM